MWGEEIDGFSLQVQWFSARALAFPWCLSNNVMKHLSGLPIILIQIQANTSSLCCVNKLEPRCYQLSLSPKSISNMRDKVSIPRDIKFSKLRSPRTAESATVPRFHVCSSGGNDQKMWWCVWGVPLQKTFAQRPVTETKISSLKNTSTWERIVDTIFFWSSGYSPTS